MKDNALDNWIKNAPTATGVYLMKNIDGKVIYVGKAKNLRKRILSYFKGKDLRLMIPFLISRIHDLELIVTDTEKEALILENNLIKEHRPRYNVNFKDDKNYLSIRINIKEDFPSFQLVRRIKKDGAKYYGPYSSTSAVKETLQVLQKIFPLRTCKDAEFKSRRRPCMEYEIKRCLAPCCGYISKEDYGKVVRDAVLFMEGYGKKLISELQAKMAACAEDFNFEEAAIMRDRMMAVEETLEKQRIVSASFKDQDVFGLYREGSQVQVFAVFIRKGCLTGKRKFPLLKLKSDSSEILSSLLKQYYDGDAFIPGEIIIPDDIEDSEVFEEWLSEKKGKKVSVVVPKRGKKLDLLNIAKSNAQNVFQLEKASAVTEEKTKKFLVEKLHLKKMPHRIECFDISNIGGKYAVGSMVLFVEGRPEKSGYKRFKIKTKDSSDDYGMMYEVLKRRYRNKDDLPDLIIVDGGKGQLGVALSVMRELDMGDVDAIGLAKKSSSEGKKDFFREVHATIYKEEDRIYLPKRKNPVYLSAYPPALFFLQRVRDEAHRFAITYHRKVKGKSDFRSILDGIPGIGNSRKKLLLKYFKGVGRIQKASKEELAAVSGIGEKIAKDIYKYFHNTYE